MSRNPEVKWAERLDKVYLTVILPDSKNAKVNLDPSGLFTFSAKAGANDILYELKLNLFDKVNVEESKINVGERNIFCVLEKTEKQWWNKLISGDKKNFIKVDWEKWVDEDEDGGDIDLGGMDFSKFGGGGDMGDDDSEESDGEEVVSKPESKEGNKEDVSEKKVEEEVSAAAATT